MNEPQRGDKIGEWTILWVEEAEDYYLAYCERQVGELREEQALRIKK